MKMVKKLKSYKSYKMVSVNKPEDMDAYINLMNEYNNCKVQIAKNNQTIAEEVKTFINKKEAQTTEDVSTLKKCVSENDKLKEKINEVNEKLVPISNKLIRDQSIIIKMYQDTIIQLNKRIDESEAKRQKIS